MSITSLRNSTRLILCFVLFFPALFKDLFRWFFFPVHFLLWLTWMRVCRLTSRTVTRINPATPLKKHQTGHVQQQQHRSPKGIRYYGNCNKFQVVASDGQ
jgi:hypothetical protein